MRRSSVRIRWMALLKSITLGQLNKLPFCCINMIEDDFSKFSEQREEIQSRRFGETYTFLKKSLSEIPQILETTGINTQVRQRFVAFGLIDNVVVSLSKEKSAELGLWILATAFQQNFERYVLKINDDTSVIKEIWVEYDLTSPLKLNLERFVWNPTSPNVFVGNSAFQKNTKMSVNVTNFEDDWITLEQFYARDVLVGFGGVEESCLAAEFFRNFSLEKSDLNYETLYHLDEMQNLCDKNSCELRVELINL